MPVRGLTDTVQPMFTSIGKLRKGDVRTANGPGPDLNYFRFTSPQEEVVAAFSRLYGEKPQEISIVLPFSEVEECFSSWREEWSNSGLVHRCDGETCVVWLDKETGQYIRALDVDVPPACPGNCKLVGRMSVVLPKLWSSGHIGLVTFETHSKRELISLTAALTAVRRLGALSGAEFKLYRELENVSVPGENGKRFRRSMWMCKLMPIRSTMTMLLPEGDAPPPPQQDTEKWDGDRLDEQDVKTLYAKAKEWGFKSPTQIALALGRQSVYDFEGSLEEALTILAENLPE